MLCIQFFWPTQEACTIPKIDFFHVTQKHKSCHQYESPVVQVVIVEPFHLPSALLHIFGRAIGRGAVSYLWVVNVHCVSPDHYALSN